MARESANKQAPEVSIITRTKDRPITLQRAFESIYGQIFRNYEWIIVNDGGTREPVDAIAERARRSGIVVRVIHNAQSRGRPGALNDGLGRASGPYIAVHDDDDTWEPTFLEVTTRYLSETTNGAIVHGVVTRTMAVEESIDTSANAIKRVTSYPYDNNLRTVTLYQMAKLDNIFPPISFLYRNEILQEIGLYREDLPVLEDWEFNLRFLKHYDIDVIPEHHANYHFRKSCSLDVYSNSVTGITDIHEIYYARLRNQLLRNDIASNKVDIGFLINICHDLESIRKMTAYNVITKPIIDRLPSFISRLLKKDRKQ